MLSRPIDRRPPTMLIDAQRIAPKLWMGSRPSPAACKVFDAIVLAAQEYQPELACETVHAPLDDAKPTRAEIHVALQAAQQVNALRSRGKRVLVTCAMGVNRSGLIVALAMMLNGSSPGNAIGRIRVARKPPSGMIPLSNRHFVEFLQKVSIPHMYRASPAALRGT